ncbi:MAG: aspartate kinase [Planctomycetota bacterium]
MSSRPTPGRPIVVQKFGGTSVGSVPRIHHVATLALAARRAGKDVVVVVSAMSGETNKLLALADEVAEPGDRRERDAIAAVGEQVSAALTAIAIQAAGGKARSFLGHQIPIHTDGNFGDARVVKVEPTVLRESLARGEIPVVAGFQGVDAHGNITTLGRGGSDTTAVAVAAALGGECDIYTDVDGVYTADPNIVKSARKLAWVSYRHMLTFAALGAKVLHDRSVELAQQFSVPTRVLTSFGDTPGTTMSASEEEIEGAIGGIACDRKMVLIFPAPGGGSIVKQAMGQLVASLADRGAVVGCQFDEADPFAFTVRSVDLPALKVVAKEREFPRVCLEDIARVSLVGYRLGKVPRLEAKAKQLLKGFGVKIRKSLVTDDYISLFVAPTDADEAMRVLHDGMAVGVGSEHGDAAKAKRRRR